jgi:hypothetical protein
LNATITGPAKPPPTLNRLEAIRTAADIARTLLAADIGILEAHLTGRLGRMLRQTRPRRLVGDIDLMLVVDEGIWDFYRQMFDLPLDYPTSKRARLAAVCGLVRAQAANPLLLSQWTNNPAYWVQVDEDPQANVADDEPWPAGAKPLLDIFVGPRNWNGSRLDETACHSVQCEFIPGELRIQGPTAAARKLLINLARDAARYDPATNGFVVPSDTLF